MMTNTDKLQAAFRRALQASDTADLSGINYGDAPAGKEWDSLRHMVLVTRLEDEFDVMIATPQVAQIRSFATAVQVLTDLGVRFE